MIKFLVDAQLPKKLSLLLEFAENIVVKF